jgi:hypothetical protein
MGCPGVVGGTWWGGSILPLEAYQLPATTQDDLTKVLKARFQLAEHLFGVAVGPILNGTSILTGTGHQHIALLLGLLTELDGFLMKPFGLGLTIPLDPQALLTDGFEFLQRLLPNTLVLLDQLAGTVHRLSLQLGAPLLGLLLELLPMGRKGLIHLGDPPLVLLLGLSSLGASLGLKLFPMEAGLLPYVSRLALGLLANGRRGDELFPLPPRLHKDLLGLLLGLLDEAFPLTQELVGLGDLQGQGFPQGVHRLDGILLVDQAPTTEGDTTAIKHDLLKLIELVENRDARLGHVNV